MVSYQGQTSDPLSAPVAAAVAGIFTTSASGSGQGAILNQYGSLNGPNNPAPVGSYVFVFATGEGQTNPAGLDGSLDGVPAPNPILPVTATLGGVNATVQFAGGVQALSLAFCKSTSRCRKASNLVGACRSSSPSVALPVRRTSLLPFSKTQTQSLGHQHRPSDPTWFVGRSNGDETRSDVFGWRGSQMRVHVLYKRPEIPANTANPAFALSVT